MVRFGFPGLALGIVLSLQVSLAAAASLVPWAKLGPEKQEILQPLAAQWDTLSPKLQKNLLHAAKRYPNLTPEEKQRLKDKLEKWSKLTPEQRKRAREKFQAFSKVPAVQREEVKQMVRQQEAKKSEAAASGTPPATPAQ
ncbi:MAG: hypothetical protein FD134_2569 [Gallionellaceae bacterium]|nr:MAG: hypothetical protein FD134_2569 [Gallionellaceae bacterium]